MDVKWLGCIQPMCSAPGHSWQGPFFFLKSRPLFRKSVFSCVCMIKPPFFQIKRPDPGKRSVVSVFTVFLTSRQNRNNHIYIYVIYKIWYGGPARHAGLAGRPDFCKNLALGAKPKAERLFANSCYCLIQPYHHFLNHQVATVKTREIHREK